MAHVYWRANPDLHQIAVVVDLLDQHTGKVSQSIDSGRCWVALSGGVSDSTLVRRPFVRPVGWLPWVSC